jgi:hypothetical protein
VSRASIGLSLLRWPPGEDRELRPRALVLSVTDDEGRREIELPLDAGELARLAQDLRDIARTLRVAQHGR